MTTPDQAESLLKYKRPGLLGKSKIKTLEVRLWSNLHLKVLSVSEGERQMRIYKRRYHWLTLAYAIPYTPTLVNI